MIRCDDILNVNAYLRSKSRQNIEDSRQLIDEIEQLDSGYDDLLEKADDLLAEALQLARDMGIEMEAPPAAPASPAPACDSCADLLVTLPEGMDFEKAFEQLKKEAEEKGFTHTRPESLLSEEDLRHAEAFSAALDERFKQDVRLTGKDLTLLIAAVALKLLCGWLFSRVLEGKKARKKERKAQLIQMLNEQEELKAVEGLDLNMLADMAQRAGQAGVNWASNMIYERFLHRLDIKDNTRIISDPIPFDRPETRFFAHEEVLGFHPMLGWLFGVMNIMTDTVTTRSMDSYAIVHNEEKLICQEISTPVHLLLPVVRNFSGKRDSLLAAVVRESQVLGVTRVPPEKLSAMLTRTMTIEEENSQVIGHVQSAAGALKVSLGKGAVTLAYTGFLNQLITAVHAVQYDEATDGDIQHYTVRTNKILTLSNAVAAVVNSMPALIGGDVSQLDFAGIITTALSLFSSTKFWVEVKANYLASAYKKEIDREMTRIDRFFETVSPEAPL